MIIDAHTHISPPEIRQNREKFFAGEDNFRLLYEDPRARLVGATQLVEELEKVGADAAVSFSFPWNDAGTERFCNDYVLDAGQRFRGRVIPFACVNPVRGASAIREAERCLAAGARGIGEIATYREGLGKAVCRKIAPLADLCAEAGVPLLIHANKQVGHDYPGKSSISHKEIYDLIKTHPKTTWILAHLGGGLFVYHLMRKEADEVLAKVYYDTAAAPFLYKPSLFRAFAESAGLGRLVYGSDYPLLSLARYKKMMEEGNLTQKEISAILGKNIAKVLGL